MATPAPNRKDQIATHTVGEGFDFACNLLANAIGHSTETRPEASPNILKTLAEYISFRYAGEDLLALEYLVLLGREFRDSAEVRWTQYWSQLEWVGRQLDVPLESLERAE